MAVKKIKQEKKPTNAQLERRIARAVVMVERVSNGKEVYFDDKWLRLYVNEDYATVGTMFHTHVFQRITASGVSRPYIYIDRFIDLAIDNDCIVQDAKGNQTRSYGKLMRSLEAKEDKTEFEIAWLVDKWLMNIFTPLYGIGENATDAFLTYESFVHNIARHSVILAEHKEDVTNKKFIEEVCAKEIEFTKNMTEDVVFEALSDEERMNHEMDAMQADIDEQTMEASADESAN